MQFVRYLVGTCRSSAQRFSTCTRFFSAVAIVSALQLTPAAAQDTQFPDLSDRSGEFLSGLANDTSAKIVEIGDFNADGLEDLVISRTGTEPVLLLNDNGVLSNETQAFVPGSSDANDSLFVEAFDANGDQWTDLIFGRTGRQPWLMMNLGADANGDWLGFDSGSAIAGTTNNLVLEAGDLDGDGSEDLFAIQVEFGRNNLLLNDGNGGFTAENARLGGLGNLARGHTALIADVEGDGDNDIVYIESDLFLHIYFNAGDAEFSDTRRRTFRNPDNFAYVFGAGDFNGDGIFDYRQYSNPAPNAEISDGTFDADGLPNFTVRTDANMLRGNRKHGTVHMRDIDGDGDLDYVLSSILRNFGSARNTTEGMRTEMVFNSGFNTGTFETFVGEDWGNEESYDMKIIDINDDGNMDMFVAHQFRYGVYINSAEPQLVEIDGNIEALPVEAGAQASLSISLLEGNPTSYTWEFGDGATATTTVPSVTYAFPEPGRYNVTVTANSATVSDQISFIQRVHEPLVAGIPQTSGDEPRSLAICSAGVLCVVNKGDASVSRIDTGSLDTLSTITLAYGSRPHGIIADLDEGLIYLVLEASGLIIKYDTASEIIVDSLDVGSSPREIALSADGSLLYAPRFITSPGPGESTLTPAPHGAEVMVIDTASFSLDSVIDVPYNMPENDVDTTVNARGIPNYLRSPALSPNGTIAVVPMKIDNIYRGSARDGQAREHDMLTRGALAQLDLGTSSENVDQRFQFDNNSHPNAVAFGPTGNYLFTVHEASRQFEVIDVYSNSIVFSDDIGFAPTGLTVSPDGTRIFIHNWLDRSLSIVDSSDLMAGTGSNADVIQTVQLVANDVVAPRILTGKKLFFDSGDLRLAAQKYISCAVCHDEAGHDGRTWDFSDAGEGLRNTIDLRGRAGVGNGNVHWSANFDEIHDFENDIREIFDGTGLLTDEDFAASAAPLDDNTPKAGRSASLDALAAFTSTLTNFGQSPHRTASGTLTPDGLAGRVVFQNSGCVACHSGDHFTDSLAGRTHNIGTVDSDTGGQLGQPLLDGGLDTPTLRGLWNGAPYLHDGAALTVEDAILAHTSNVDFDVSSLSSSELGQLADYLLQIDDNEPAPANPAAPPVTVDPNADSTEFAIAIDGDFSEWPQSAIISVDPDDTSGADNPIDLARVWMAHDNTDLFVRFDNHAPDDVVLSWGYAIYIDVNGADGYRGFSNELPIGVDFLIEGDSLYRYDGSGNDFLWAFVTSLQAQANGGAAELAIPRVELGNPADMRYFMVGNNAVVQGSARDYLPDNAVDTTVATSERSFSYSFGGAAAVVNPLAATANATFNLAAGIAIDGNLADWRRFPSLGTDPDDVSGATNTLDWREVWMAHNANDFFFAWQNDGPAEVTWGNGVMLDTDQNRSTGFTGFDDELPIGVDYLIEERVLHFYVGAGTDWAWRQAGVVELNTSGDNTEIAVSAATLGNPPHIDVFFFIDNAAVGGTATDFFPDAAGDELAALDRRFFTYTTVEPVVTPSITPVIDGRLAEWPAQLQVGGDDETNASRSDTIDWSKLFMTSDTETLYIGFENHSPVLFNWGYGIYMDTDGDISTGFNGFSSELPLGADFLLEGNSLVSYTGASQTEWSWSAPVDIAIAASGNSGEVAIPLTSIASPSNVTLLLRGDNAAVNGDSVDLLPNEGVIEYSLALGQPINAVDSQPLLDGEEQPALQAATAADAQVNSSEVIAQAATTTEQSSGVTTGGSGAMGWQWLLLMLAAGFQRIASVVRMRLLMVTTVTSLAVVLTACDTGESGGGLTTTAQPNNQPGFDSAPQLGAANATNEPNNNPSLGAGLVAILNGVEMVPVVATNEAGTVRVALNPETGELTGDIAHTVNDAVAAAIYRAPAGFNGELVLSMISTDSDNATFEVPAATFLDSQQQAELANGDYYAVVHTLTEPGGHLRAQLSSTPPPVTLKAAIDDLQAKIFAPTCSGCHTGGGDTLPASMDFTTTGATIESLINVQSVQEPQLTRVVPGNADASYLINKLEGTQLVGSQMPFRGTPLTEAEIATVRAWIDEGALP